jgi:hypothetical protein
MADMRSDVLAIAASLGGGGGPDFTDPKRFTRFTNFNGDNADAQGIIIGGSVNYSGQTGFWNDATYGIGSQGVDDDTNYSAATYKTILNLTANAGVLFGVIGPAIADSGDTCDIRITRDGVATTISHSPGVVNYRFGLGHFAAGATFTSGNIGYLTPLSADKKVRVIGTLGRTLFDPTMVRAMGGGGLRFDASLLIEIRVTSAQSSTTKNARRSGAIYVLEA